MFRAAGPLLFDPYDYSFHDDPYPLYARLRDEAPLYYSDPGRFWVLSRHADVQATLRDDVTFSNRMGVSLDASAWNPDAHRVMSFLALDGEAQMRLRRLVSAAFTPRRVRELEPQASPTPSGMRYGGSPTSSSTARPECRTCRRPGWRQPWS